MTPTAVSLIVCTRDRADRLGPFFDAVRALQAPPGGWELILVDNASTDATATAIERFAVTAPCEVTYVRTEQSGLARARNAGLARARGAILAFTDDDCYPRTDYLLALVEVFREHPVGVVGGRVVLHDRTDAVVGIADLPRPVDMVEAAFIRAGVIHGANMAIRRDVLVAVGGFDPLLGAGTPCVAGEDIEYVARAVWAGWGARYDPRPVVAHHHGRKPGPDEEKQRRGYDVGRGAYFARLILEPAARGAYLRAWYARTRRQLRPGTIGAVARELAGALRYLAARIVRPEPVPRFPAGATPVGAESSP